MENSKSVEIHHGTFKSQKSRKVLKVKNLVTKEVFYYTTVTGMLLDERNPINVNEVRISQLKAASGGFPFVYKACKLSEIEVWNVRSLKTLQVKETI